MRLIIVKVNHHKSRKLCFPFVDKRSKIDKGSPQMSLQGGPKGLKSGNSAKASPPIFTYSTQYPISIHVASVSVLTVIKFFENAPVEYPSEEGHYPTHLQTWLPLEAWSNSPIEGLESTMLTSSAHSVVACNATVPRVCTLVVVVLQAQCSVNSPSSTCTSALRWCAYSFASFATCFLWRKFLLSLVLLNFQDQNYQPQLFLRELHQTTCSS